MQLPIVLQKLEAPSDGLPILDILDQSQLPLQIVRLPLSTPEAIQEAIRSLRVRGAPAIGGAAALGLAVCACRFPERTREAFLAHLHQTGDFLKAARPTAVNLAWAIDRCLKRVMESSGEVPALQQLLLEEAQAIIDEDRALCERIGEAGLAVLHPHVSVLTHCNAGALATCGIGTALAPIYKAAEKGWQPVVYSDETRPLLQGARLTAWELSTCGIPVTTICDSMAAQVMREGKIDVVIVGADRVAANGDAANKIGTYQLAIAAQFHHIPFYVAFPYSTIDATLPDGSLIPIEQRSADEIQHCPNAAVYNPAFDVTPHELITGYITERGLLKQLQ